MKPKLIEQAAFIGRLARIFSVISWIATVLLALSMALAIAMLFGDHAALGPVFIDWNDPFFPLLDIARWQFLARGAGMLFLPFAALVWLAWIYSATRFLRIAGVDKPHHGPLSAVILHLVPVIGMAMPMVIMSELERATRDPSQWRELDNYHPATTGWLVGTLSFVALIHGVALQQSPETLNEYVTGLWLVIASSAGCIAGLYLFNRYLKHMEALQQALAARIELSPEGSR